MVEGFDDAYRVGSDGSVWSRWRRSTEYRVEPDGSRFSRLRWSADGEWRLLRLVAFERQGNLKSHLKVTLHGGRQRQVHRLVCAAFHGPPPTPKHEAAHLDGNPANNAAGNLAWETRGENAADMARHGTVCQGERHGQHKLTEAEVLEMRRRYLADESQESLAERYGVSQGEVSMVLSGRRWGWLDGGKVERPTLNRGERHGQSKLTEAIVREMREAHRAGEAKRALARRFGVSQMTVIRVISGKSWGWLE